MDNLKQIIEAYIFVSETPLSLERLCVLTEKNRSEIRPVLEQLLLDYSGSERGFYLAEVAGGYQFRTQAELAPYLKKLARDRSTRLSQAALETLSIIAYRQPATRAEIEYLRGVDSGGVMKTLLDKNLLKILGKKDVPGRPLMYGTSRHVLELFNLRSLNDLPTLKDFSALDSEVAEADPLNPEEAE